MKFKKGDKVKLKKNEYYFGLENERGRIYTVKNVQDAIDGSYFIQLEERNLGNIFASRFELVKAAPAPKAPKMTKRVGITAKDLAFRNLELAEDLCLRALGWRVTRSGQYRPPKGYSTVSIAPGGTYDRNHAINSIKKNITP